MEEKENLQVNENVTINEEVDVCITDKNEELSEEAVVEEKTSESTEIAESTEETATLSSEEEIINKKKKRRKKIISTTAFITFNIIAIAVVLWLELKDSGSGFVGFGEVSGIINNLWYFLVIGFLMYFVHVFCDAIAYFALIRQCGYGNRFGLALRVAFVGKYYDNITPFNTGGQPFQIAYMTKSNIDIATSCSLPIIKYVIRLFTADIVIIVIFAITGFGESLFVTITAFAGMVVMAFLPLMLVVFSRYVDFVLRITEKFVALLHRMKLVKDYDKTVAKAKDTMDSFLAAFKYLGLHKKMIVIIGIVSVIDFLALSSIPYFLIRTLGGTGDVLQVISKINYVSLMASLFPTPGASGASEGSFYSVFETAVPEGCLFWAVLLWRIIIFYTPIFIGFCMQVVEWLVGHGKVKLVKKEMAWLSKKTIKTYGGGFKDKEA